MLSKLTPLAYTFVRVLAWHPYKAAVAAWWYLVGKRMRARNRLRSAAIESPFAYAVWIRMVERRLKAAACNSHALSPQAKPQFAVLVFVPADGLDKARHALASILAQTCQPAEIFVGGPGACTDWPQFDALPLRRLDANTLSAALSAAIRSSECAYLVPLSHEALLARDALLQFTQASLADTADAVALLYGDQDEQGPRGQRVAPWLKPQWNYELFLAQDYLGGACAIPIEPVRRISIGRCPGGDPLYGLLLDLVGTEGVAVRHVPHIIIHAAPASWKRGADERQAELELRLAARGARIEPGPFGTTSVIWALPSGAPSPRPTVSIIVPTRDRLDLLKTCVDGVLARTDWPNFEVLVVDNGSVEATTLRYFDEVVADTRVRVLPFDQAYNFSAINNFAACNANGDYLCLLNNDTEIVEPGWLTELMRYALRSDAGAVGARLLYPDRSLQHAGVVVGLGGAAGHAHRGLPDGDTGYFARAYLAHAVTAVTAACLVVRKDRYLAVGGLDAAGLAIAYNDIDLCLKLRAQGWQNFYAPRSVLIHHESKSRGQDLSPPHVERYRAELAVFQKRWNTMAFADPLHHRSLDSSSETFRLDLGEPW